jgi:hypothetical protein
MNYFELIFMKDVIYLSDFIFVKYVSYLILFFSFVYEFSNYSRSIC